MLLWILLFLGALWLLWKDSRLTSYWEKRGVPSVAASPIYRPRSILRSMIPGIKSISQLYQSTTAPILGFFKGRTPVLMVRDPALVSAIMQADFNHFSDKRLPAQLDIAQEPLSQHLLGLTGEKWKSVRSKLTPVFSSGKIKESLPLIEEAVDALLPQLGPKPVDVYPVAVSIVTDVIVSYAFGLSRDDPNREVVRKMGMKSIESSFLLAVKRAIRFYLPGLFRILGLRAFDPEVTDFFTEFVRRAISEIQRLDQRGRVDFISRLSNIAAIASEQEKNGLIAAQVFSFYVAGFETTCFALATCLYELSKSPDVFAKARVELDRLLETRGRFDYEALQEATYLSQIVEESMRMYPAAYSTPRVCTKQYQIPGTDIILEQGTEILIPAFCLSRDPSFFRNPLEFDPERFSKENKPNITPGTNLPFGDGPRKCIAVRFSMVELKYIIARVISAYDLELHPSTPEHLVFDEHARVTHYCGIISVTFKKRKDQPLLQAD